MGKSVTFQLPAIMLEGTCIVVSPLLALMADQIESLQAKGIPCLTINSTLGVRERRKAIETLKEGKVKLIYMAPETLLNEEIINLINEFINISFIAFDEAHIISSWGNGFRPKYAQVGKVREVFKKCPIAAFTATADPITKQDIISILSLKTADLYVHSFDRPNIQYNVYHKVDEYSQILRIVNKYPEGTNGIIYCMTKDKTEAIAAYLKSKDIKAESFHAGMNLKTKTITNTVRGKVVEKVIKGKNQVQEEYMNGDINIIVATIAFGMGIDKADVRFVIHADVPTSFEGYSQETGRAARDGLKAEVYLLYSKSDIAKAKWMITETILNPERRQINLNKLQSMVSFCEMATCRRIKLLKYFGEFSTACGNCDNCLIINKNKRQIV